MAIMTNRFIWALSTSFNTINARFDYRNLIEYSLIVFGMSCQGFDDEPLVGICLSHSRPDYAYLPPHLST
jgi:hypothetical protein